MTETHKTGLTSAGRESFVSREITTSGFRLNGVIISILDLSACPYRNHCLFLDNCRDVYVVTAEPVLYKYSALYIPSWSERHHRNTLGLGTMSDTGIE